VAESRLAAASSVFPEESTSVEFRFDAKAAASFVFPGKQTPPVKENGRRD